MFIVSDGTKRNNNNKRNGGIEAEESIQKYITFPTARISVIICFGVGAQNACCCFNRCDGCRIANFIAVSCLQIYKHLSNHLWCSTKNDSINWKLVLVWFFW